ncbi:hypothetical protein GCM10020331_073040 [Ectobacillus funiculus]
MFRYFKFRLNDTVQFAENDGHIYRIVGYRLEKKAMVWKAMKIGRTSYMNYFVNLTVT